MYILRIILILMVYSVNQSAADTTDIGPTLKSCSNYNENSTMQQGVFDWIAAVDEISTCDMNKITFMLAKKNTLTIKSNLAILKTQYEFCDGVINLSETFTMKLNKLIKMQDDCNAGNNISINHEEQLSRMQLENQRNEEILLHLKKQRKAIEFTIKEKNNNIMELDNKISELEKHIYKNEKAFLILKNNQNSEQ